MTPHYRSHFLLSPQDSDASIPLMVKVFNRPLQIATGRPESSAIERPVVASMPQSQSATPAETLVDHRATSITAIPPPPSVNISDSDSVIEPLALSRPVPLQRVKTAKKPQQYLRPSPSLKGASPKPSGLPQKRKSPSKCKIAVLNTEESIELAIEAEGPRAKKARTNSSVPPDTQPTPSVLIVAPDESARDLENWAIDIDADANIVQTAESTQIAPEQQQELSLPPLELPLDDELPVEVPLSRPSITIVPPIWASVSILRCFDVASD